MRELHSSVPIIVKPAFVFDFDGVIVHSTPHWKQVSHQFLQGLIPTWSEQDQRRLFGLSARSVYERLTAHYGLQLSWEEYVRSYEALASEIYGKLAGPVAGALELLAFLDQAGYELAMATSAPRGWVQLALDRFSLEPRFRVIVAAEDVGPEIKPSPRPYLLAAERLGRLPGECIAVEDSLKGIRSAKSAGLCCIALKSPDAGAELAEADLLLESFEEIPVRRFGEWLNERLVCRSAAFHGSIPDRSTS